MKTYELNIDGLVGPSHHYAGLSIGNIASTHNALTYSNPQQAALQGLNKMRLLHQAGLKQAVMPPHQRPNLALLHNLGFHGTPAQQIKKAKQTCPKLLSACYSAASMWTANAATVSASIDCHDNHVHFTAANLISNLHRHQEADFSSQLLRTIFSNEHFFTHHPVLPKTIATADEGAANHSRLCQTHGQAGINLFVYGKQALSSTAHHPLPKRFPARQALEACEAIARNHQLNASDVLFACQHPNAIDHGVFHNDVIAVANENVLLIHEEALLDQQKICQQLIAKASFPITIIEVLHDEISLMDAVNSYLFNSQLITLPNQTMALFAPKECKEHPNIQSFLDNLIASNSNPIQHIHYLDLKQSMRNGGGPACLRLRVPLTDEELASMHPGVIINDALLIQLETCIRKYYRTQLCANDLDDPILINECFTALDELSRILQLGSIYPFQQS